MSDNEELDSSSDNNNPDALDPVSLSQDDSNSSNDEMISMARRQIVRLIANHIDWRVCHESSGSSQESEGEAAGPKVTPKVLSKPKPKHNWFALKEIINREYCSQVPPSSFTRRYYSSLHAVRRLEKLWVLHKHNGCVNAINFNASGTRLISGSDDRTVAVWDWARGKLATRFNTGHTSNVFQCKYLPLNGDLHIVTCSRDGQVRLATRMSNGTYKCYTKLVQHNKACHKLATLPHTPHVLLSAGEDAQVFSIDVREKKPVRLMNVREKTRKICLYSINANPMTGNEFCVAGEDYYVRIYDRRYIPRNGAAEIKFKPSHMNDNPFTIYVTCAVFNYNGTEVIGSYNDDDVYLFDAKHSSNSDFIHKYEGHRNAETVKGVNFYGPKSEYVVSGSDCGYIYIWDKNTEGVVQWMKGDEEGVINCLEPHPHMPVLATSGMDPDVKLWVPFASTDPTFKNLDRCVRLNQVNRGNESTSSITSFRFNVSLVNRVWRRYMPDVLNQNAGSDNYSVLVSSDMIRGLFDDTSMSSSSSSDSSSS